MTIPKGKLIPIGGSEVKEPGDNAASSELRQIDFFESGIMAEFLEEVKGNESRIEVIPAASDIPEEMGESYLKAFREMGCKNVHALHINSHDQADSRENRQRIDKADAVLFTGGDQITLVDKLLDTRLVPAITNAIRMMTS
jgi:cyanophycinase